MPGTFDLSAKIDTMNALVKRLTPLRVLAACAALGAFGAPLSGAAQTVQTAPMQEVSVAGDVPLRGYWFAGAGAGVGEGVGSPPRPAILALHGCGGLFAGKEGERLGERYREAAARMNAMGYAVLLPDSFGSRGVRQICQTRYAERTITVAQRARDAEAALVWLARQPDVDPARIGVLGWSNGGSTALHLLEQMQLQLQRKAGAAPDHLPSVAAAAVFYPGCQPLRLRRADLGTVPLLMQIGALDDWTPAPPCEALVQQLRARPGTHVELHLYPDSYHGFDSRAPVRLRTDVPNGGAGQGVHQGGNPQARAQSLQVLDAFWRSTLSPTKALP